MNDLVIRRAETSDVRAIVDVHIASWRVAYAPILMKKHFDWVSEKREIRRTRGMLKDGTSLLVAERDGAIVGFMAYGRPGDEKTNKPGVQEIFYFFVHPDWMRQGIGAALLESMIEREPPRRIYVWVLTGVDAGPAFYEKNGFQPEQETRTDFIFLDEGLPTIRYCKSTEK